MLLYGKMSTEEFNESLIERHRFTDTDNYFRELGNYFINISEYNKTRKPLEERLSVLYKKEKKLKEKLGIK
jgi:chaperonin cofactor prefoldin